MRRIFFIIFAIVFQLNGTILYSNPNSKKANYEEGETLKYLVYYGWVDGGVAELSIKKTERDDKEVFFSRAFIETVGVAKVFVPLRDTYTSYFDQETGMPYFAVRDVKEGDYEKYNEVTFDNEKSVVHSKNKGTIKVPENTFDILSAFYFARKYKFENIKIGDTIHLSTYFTDKILPFDIVYKGKEKIKTEIGTFPSLKFMPVCEVGRVFDDEDDMTIYISDDENKLPVRMEFDMLIGSLKCDLIEYKGTAKRFARK